ncbi:MAG: DUF3365 domain-containing protein [Thermodesulfovibrionales bacterium]
MFLSPFIIALSIFLVLMFTWETKKLDDDQLSEMEKIARTSYEQLMITRVWNARHGGVYVPVTGETPPDSYLSGPGMEITSSTGQRYAKINPAYMTKELSDLTEKARGVRFRLVSLKPAALYSSPDDWERSALREFGAGRVAKAMTIETDNDGNRSFRYILPLRVEEVCLQCHGKNGYESGDIKGGISITLPMEGHDFIQTMKSRRVLYSMISIAVSSIIFMGVVIFYVSRRLTSEIEKNIERQRLEAIVELAGASAHEMRQPMTVILNVLSLIREKARHNEPLDDEEVRIINDQCDRMNNIIKKMLNITSYKTKEYIKGKRIVDLDESSRRGEQ